METILIYFIKANVLLTVFYLSYRFLVEKETFFNSNRWFLLLGLFTSVLIPLFFIEKIVWIDAVLTPEINNSAEIPVARIVSSPEIQNFINWNDVLYGLYMVIVFILFSRILLYLISLFKLLYKQEITKVETFSLVDITEKISPFSFFKYIVFNSRLYTDYELQSILLHEKVHSREKHSLDLLIAQLFCIVFWINPIVWLYKKAIIQNLEYIADHKAIKNIEDKKVYQKALLKVVTDHNCLPITNNFYQSLIKKRIVMLNKNQSKQRNAWKYFVIIPVLVAFIMLYQVKIVAQEKSDPQFENGLQSDVTEVRVTKTSTDSELKEDVKQVKKYANVDLKFSKIKRNKNGEITAITANFNDNKGSKGQHKIDGETPINDFVFSVKQYRNGKSEIGFFESNADADISEVQVLETLNELEPLSPPIPPTPPTPPITLDMSDMPTPPSPPNMPLPPSIKVPTDPNDRKAWKQYEEAMEKFSKEWENNHEMEKFETAMKIYEAKMEKWEPNMKAFEKEMEKFEAKMEAFQSKMESYEDNLRDRNQERQDEIRARMNAKRDEINARRDAETAKRDTQLSRLTSREQGEIAREAGRIAREKGAIAREKATKAREEARKLKIEEEK